MLTVSRSLAAPSFVLTVLIWCSAGWVPGVVDLVPLAHAAPTSDLEARKVFNELFGSEIARVKRTTDREDDLTLAKTIMSTADTAEDPALIALMYETVFDLASKSKEGQDLAMQALDTLGQKVPDRAAAANVKLVSMLQRQYTTARGKERTKRGQELIEALLAAADAQANQGDHREAMTHYRRALGVATQIKSRDIEMIRDAIEAHNLRQKAAAKVDALQRRLVADPTDKASADELIRLLIVDLGEPARAKDFALLYQGQQRRNVELAAADAKDVKAEDALELARWYEGFGDSTNAEAQKLEMYDRAGEFYRRFMAVYTKNDLKRTSAKVKADQLDKKMAGLEKARLAKMGVNENKFTGETLTLEAERADAILAPMRVVNDTSASNGRYVVHPYMVAGDPLRGRMVFYVNADKRYKVNIWVKARCQSYRMDQIKLAVAEGKTMKADYYYYWYLYGPFTNWSTKKYSSYRYLEPGWNSIIITGYEKGVAIDRVAISAHESGIPSSRRDDDDRPRTGVSSRTSRTRKKRDRD